MKNRTKRLFAFVLILTLIVSVLAPTYANAEDSKVNESYNFSGEQSFIKTENDNGSSYYGVTGNDKIGSEPPAGITIIDSLEDYYSIINESADSKKSVASTGCNRRKFGQYGRPFNGIRVVEQNVLVLRFRFPLYGADIFFRLKPGCHDLVSAAAAAQTEVRANAQHLPFPAAAGMLFLQF